jgi:hypothetical protein
VTNEDWKVGFRKAMIDALIKSGTPVSKDAGFYGWIDYDGAEIKAAIRAGEIDYDATAWDDVDWYEFMGTFYEGDTRKTGIDINVVMTNGDTYKLRYAGTVGELINAVVSDE